VLEIVGPRTQDLHTTSLGSYADALGRARDNAPRARGVGHSGSPRSGHVGFRGAAPS